MRRILEVGVLCNNAAVTAADPDEEESHGDPTEVALLAAALVHGIDRSALLEERPEAREEPFNSDTMMMATFHEIDGAFEVAVKGAPKYVLDACTAIVGEDGSDSRPLEDKERQEWLERTTSLAGEGLRLLAIADKRVDNTEAEPYTDLRFLGLVGLFDPPREDVREAIAECKGAGIRVVMVTGDQPETARAIALDVGLVTAEDATVVHGGDLKDPKDLSDEDRNEILNTAIFARVSPEQKLNLIKVYQDAQYTVAMTGDGVNDAPALKKADIGVAMGIRGTPAAREVADMVLKDDALSSIAAAVEQGRIIFSNIRKSVLFMLCTNVAEIVAVTVASLATIPIPLLPLHILYLNVLTDVFPALALGMGKGSSDVMKNPPRPQGEAVLTKRHWRAIAGWALLVGACVLAALLLALYWLDLDERSAVTVSFMTLGFTKLWFVFNLRDRGSSFLHNDIVNNPYIWGAMAFCMALLLAAVYMPGLSGILQTRALGWHAWALVLAASLVPFLVGQVIRAFQQAPANEAKAGEA
jgi:Ca2+-transporting ATPase